MALSVFVHPTTPVDSEVAGWGSLAPHLGFPQDRFLKSGDRAGLWQPADMSFDEVSTRIFYDCVSGHAPAIRLTYDTIGPDQMVFGYDCPHVPIDGSLNALRSLRLAGDEERMILGENAKKFLRNEALA